MSLIKPRTNRVRTVRHISRLQEPNRDALVQYARFIGDTADYVLNQLIDTTLLKDQRRTFRRQRRPCLDLRLDGGHFEGPVGDDAEEDRHAPERQAVIGSATSADKHA